MEKDKHAQSTAAASPSTTPSAESGSQQHESVNAASTSGTGSGVDAGKVNATPDGVVIPTIQEPVSNQMLMLAMDNLRLGISNLRTEMHSEMDNLRLEISNLRTEMHLEIDKLRMEMHSEIGKLRMEMHSEIGKLRTEMHSEIDKLRTEMHSEINKLRLDMKNFVIEAIVASEKSIKSELRSEMRDMEARLGVKIWQATGMIIAAFTLASVLE
ncbi:MAG: hypothetical protein ACNYPG_02925 [Candidatus Porifericomitaceae bacterium WSBS_2022_MAG_OTU9]